MTDRLLLIGMMGAGKSSVGRLVARRLGWRFVDSDADVQARTGMTVPDIFAKRGEAAFRAEESKSLARAVTSDVPTVVAVAGGAVLDPRNRTLIRRGGTVVWLRARPDVLARRVGAGEGRPLLAGDAAAAVSRLDRQRRPVYSQLAHLVVDVDQLGAQQVADRVVAFVGSRRRASSPGATP